MATAPGILSEWPWERMGNMKYLLFLPIVAKSAYQNLTGNPGDNICLHVLLGTALRYLHGQAWMTVSRFYAVTEKHQIQRKGTSFKQVDREGHWDDYLILQAWLIVLVHGFIPAFQNMPMWDTNGILTLLLLHAGPTEFIYYWAHRALHHHSLFSRYHSHHHSSFVTEPITGVVHPFAEHILYALNFAIPLIGTRILGGASIGMLYFYWLWFDFMNAIGHCNFEFIPTWVFKAFPPLKYLVYTPSFHSLHHTQVHTNFSLFMPIYDYLGGTVDKNTDLLYENSRKGRKDQVDSVFLAHGTELLSLFHLSFGIPSFAAQPYKAKWYLLPLWPLTVPIMLALWAFGHPFVADTYSLEDKNSQTWIIPRYSFQYSMKSERKRINRLIEEAILSAEANGVKVISLGALNKSEQLNGGGKIFVQKHQNLNIRVVHGDTLTAAAVVHKIPKDVTEVFLTGATSIVGRAVALYLCRRDVRVLMLTSSQERFESIFKEAPVDCRKYLVHVTKYQDGANCKTWIIGKTATVKEQQSAPSGTHFNQFAIPALEPARKDCTYGTLAAMHLPKTMKGVRACEMTLPRGVVHASHAGGLVHALEGWPHHEVGQIDVNRMDVIWNAALRHGFLPVD
ncbi:hypothetical protein R1sor_008427 [Riccia sorocarpa]|uniref:Aldehyde oxygenase (deformylating) n=1 Tax=Riccia sorocarpa TaxID=122646 RepID=A0ABD3HVI1_9MARC